MKKRLLFTLMLALSLSSIAQISFPIKSFYKNLGLSAAATTVQYRGASLSLDLLGGLLYRVHYSGKKGDLQTAADVIAAAIGDPAIKKPFINWMSKNSEALGKHPKPLTVGLGQGYYLVFEKGDGLRFSVIPVEAPPGSFASKAHIRGKSGVVIHEYSDFQCPACKALFQRALPEVDKRYVDSGKARFEYRHFPLFEIHKKASAAAIASECAARQGKFWQFHDALFNKGVDDPKALAAGLGLDMRSFEQCIGDKKTKAIVDGQRAEAEKLKLNGTPSVFVGPFLLPNPFDVDSYARYLKMAEAKETK